mgnify:CR=1 FL=1
MRHHGKTYVRWNDLDAFGHINNANYLTFIQEVRADFTWYSRIAKGLKPMFSDMVVARAEIDYLEPITEGGFEIDIAIWVSKIGNSSFTLEYELTSNIDHVWKALQNQKPDEVELMKSQQDWLKHEWTYME